MRFLFPTMLGSWGWRSALRDDELLKVAREFARMGDVDPPVVLAAIDRHFGVTDRRRPTVLEKRLPIDLITRLNLATTENESGQHNEVDARAARAAPVARPNTHHPRSLLAHVRAGAAAPARVRMTNCRHRGDAPPVTQLC